MRFGLDRVGRRPGIRLPASGRQSDADVIGAPERRDRRRMAHGGDAGRVDDLAAMQDNEIAVMTAVWRPKPADAGAVIPGDLRRRPGMSFRKRFPEACRRSDGLSYSRARMMTWAALSGLI